MSTVISYTAAGAKSATKANLDKDIFGIEVKNHDLLKSAYVAYLSNSRINLAKVKTRGEVVGSTKKPWKQKGTGRARFGSKYNPIWRGGGITFGPTGEENYKKALNTTAKRVAIKQALSLKAKESKIVSIDSFDCKDGKTKSAVNLLSKIEATGRVLVVVSDKTDLVQQSVKNIADVKAVQATYLNVFDVLNADKIVIEKKAFDVIAEWLNKKDAK